MKSEGETVSTGGGKLVGQTFIEIRFSILIHIVQAG